MTQIERSMRSTMREMINYRDELIKKMKCCENCKYLGVTTQECSEITEEDRLISKGNRNYCIKWQLAD